MIAYDFKAALYILACRMFIAFQSIVNFRISTVPYNLSITINIPRSVAAEIKDREKSVARIIVRYIARIRSKTRFPFQNRIESLLSVLSRQSN